MSDTLAVRPSLPAPSIVPDEWQPRAGAPDDEVCESVTFVPDWLPASTQPADVVDLRDEAAILHRTKGVPRADITNWCQRAHDCLNFLARNEPEEIPQWQRLIMPYFMKSRFLTRCRTQPKGYAGDYLTVQMMYDARPGGLDGFGNGVDAWALNQPCPKAVRNRRHLVRNMLMKACADFGKDVHVVSLGCGPAAEVFDLAGHPGLRFTLIDIDADAIGYVQSKIRAADMSSRITALRANILKMTLRDDVTFRTPPSVFYSLGVIDYLSDELVVRMLDYCYAKLAPGGIAFLGNFRPDHPNAALFEHALNWPLALRSKRDLYRLVQKSKFAGCLVTIGAEREGVQLFVECRKPF